MSFFETLGNALMEGGDYGMKAMGYGGDDSFSLLDKMKRNPVNAQRQAPQETEGWQESNLLPGYGIRNLMNFLQNSPRQPMGQYDNFLGQGMNQWRF